MLNLNLLRFMVYPSYVVQRKGLMSDDELGWTWQCNVFGHYTLVRIPLRNFTCARKLNDSLRALVCIRGVLVPSIGGKACGIADGTRARHLDVIVHDRGAHL